MPDPHDYDTYLHNGEYSIDLDRSRDDLLTPFGRATLQDRYLLPGEGPQDMFARVSCAYADNPGHAQRMYDYMSQHWFMPATPVLSNGGAGKGLPISCYLNEVGDSLESIVDTWAENVHLASQGGGIGTHWGNVRSINEPIGKVGKTSGIVPFQVVQNYITMAISQGSQRRGAAAAYLDISHPEIEEFLEMRKPSGDFNRKSLYLHQGLLITDAFMEAVKADADWELKSPRTGEVRKTVKARPLFERIVETRLQTGEPYMVFIDTVNRMQPEHHKKLGLKVSTSNLCAEITLPTGIDHLGNDRTAVCCLSSLNLEKWYDWHDNAKFIEDIMRFLDNVLSEYIAEAPNKMARAKYSAMRERSVGLGVMGFHAFLQSQGVPLESAVAKSYNMKMFTYIKKQVDAASKYLALAKGPCPDSADVEGSNERFSNKTSIAPTASISIIAGGTSAGIDPVPANVYTHKTASGSFVIRSPHLVEVLKRYDRNDDKTWDSILENGGSAQHLTFLTDQERATFKTQFEIDQRWLLELASDRAPLIDQSQSLNLFVDPHIDKWDLMMLHFTAWKSGVKSLYYLRSQSAQRAAHAGGVEADNTLEAEKLVIQPEGPTDYDECLACQ